MRFYQSGHETSKQIAGLSWGRRSCLNTAATAGLRSCRAMFSWNRGDDANVCKLLSNDRAARKFARHKTAGSLSGAMGVVAIGLPSALTSNLFS